MTYFIKLENGQPVGNPILEENFLQLAPSSFSSRIFLPEEVEPLGYGIYDFAPQPELGRYEKAVEVAPVREPSGVWRQTWAVEPMSADEVVETDNRQSAIIRSQRNSILSQSDWTQLTDAPLTPEAKTAWATYRQALRDVPDQAGFPWDVQWPDQPTG